MSEGRVTNLLVVLGCLVIGGVGLVLDPWAVDPPAPPEPGLSHRPPSIADHLEPACSAIVNAQVELRMCLHRHASDGSCRCSLEVWNPSSKDLVHRGPMPLWPFPEVRVAAGARAELFTDACLDWPLRSDPVVRCEIYELGRQSLAVSVHVDAP